MATTRIKELRERTGLSQTEFSQRYGIPRLTLISWENGTRHCPVYTVELLKFRIEHEDK